MHNYNNYIVIIDLVKRLIKLYTNYTNFSLCYCFLATTGFGATCGDGFFIVAGLDVE